MPAGISATMHCSSTLPTQSTSSAMLIPVLSPCSVLTATNATPVGTDSHRLVPHTGPLRYSPLHGGMAVCDAWRRKKVGDQAPEVNIFSVKNLCSHGCRRRMAAIRLGVVKAEVAKADRDNELKTARHARAEREAAKARRAA